ncbi:YifB family Mg chelatase-like AAA ATPase [Vogesella indigofera]|uniref:YifB family Mg chelatase-like AAA ATPase n=1 Tax=Vogesella indigofera TaxID=45465 RepID=UPI00234F1474|nr:YifB family Mg chelatase-like AAA ATPase [Vogesella indigofera]MDC7697749.1 YifB family Mg chelatase-like AAA ATPase [Vogesella indigofera]
MTLAVCFSRTLSGLCAPQVSVEVHLSNGLPSFTLVGLPDTEVKESRERVRAALLQSGFDFPARRITVNLAPADLPKESGRFDLPLAIALLAAAGQLPAEQLAGYELAGELGLGGELRPVRGALAMVSAARDSGRAFILPRASANEAALVHGVSIFAADTLAEVCAHLAGVARLQAVSATLTPPAEQDYPDLSEVRGQGAAKLALELAAAGGHSLLMQGPPGTGKSMLAARLPGILPPMTLDEALESAAVQSLGSQGFALSRWRTRPYRSPHHTASAVALVGGGSEPRPGEISLAHRGVLFLDELPEYDRKVLEVLREPLESGEIHISRAARQVTYPARFQLLAAMNPCPCGYLGHPRKPCRCTPEQVSRYRAKISGPLLDRFDLMVEVGGLSLDELQALPSGEGSQAVRERVAAARERQLQRQGKINAELNSAELAELCPLPAAESALLNQMLDKLDLSARAYFRVLRIARTLADLGGHAYPLRSHLLQAVQFRRGLASFGSR